MDSRDWNVDSLAQASCLRKQKQWKLKSYNDRLVASS